MRQQAQPQETKFRLCRLEWRNVCFIICVERWQIEVATKPFQISLSVELPATGPIIHGSILLCQECSAVA